MLKGINKQHIYKRQIMYNAPQTKESFHNTTYITDGHIFIGKLLQQVAYELGYVIIDRIE